MSSSNRRPRAFVIDEESETKPKHKATIDFAPEEPEPAEIVVAPAQTRVSRSFRWGPVLIGALASLVTMGAGLAAARLVEDFFARSQVLGWIAASVAGVAALAALAIVLREIWGLARLKRIEHIQTDAASALNLDDREKSAAAIAGLRSLYGGRADMARGLRLLKEHDTDILDPRDRLRLAERYLLEPLDAEAHRIVARAARRITLITTVLPAPALDILVVAAQNLRMLRELAGLYGGRPSTLSTLRLARMVVSHLAVTGGLALSDSVVQHLVGKGLAGRLSARFGEGAVNGILTARIGLAAREVCRPIPQEPSRRENLTSLLKELVSFGKDPP